jgi:hypothetical protein
MAFEYKYGVYNPGQYPDAAQAAWDALVADGWQIHTALPNYSEICILWQRELPGKQAEKKPAAKDEKGSA